MDVTSTNRTATRAFYLAYLQSPEWRQMRNRALKRARYACEECGARRDLQVHHLSYERLGHEADSDLEVQCFDCHRGYHLEETTQGTAGVYLKLAREALNGNRWATIADLADTVKWLCVKHKLKNDAYVIHRALNLLTGSRSGIGSDEKRYVSVVEAPADEPTTAAQAKELLIRMGFLPGLAIKTMPATELPPMAQAEHEASVRHQADVMRNLHTRRSRLERLREIWNGMGI